MIHNPVQLTPRILRRFSVAAASLLLAAVLLVTGASPSQAAARYASIVVEVETGRVLYARDADTKLHPASLTKMMTLYMLFEAMGQGKVNLKTRMPVSARAEGQTPTKLGLRRGQTIAVEDAIKALVVRSANDVATVVAEFLGGTESTFANMMTQRARALGMASTTFRNASGLHNQHQVSTVRDMARLSIALRRDHPQHYHYFAMRSFRWNGKTINSHNRVLGQYRGADGLKTGFIRASGFNLASSAQRNGRTLIGVVFGGKTAKWRDQHMMALLDRGFSSATVVASAPRPLPKPITGQVASVSPDAASVALADEEQAAAPAFGSLMVVQPQAPSGEVSSPVALPSGPPVSEPQVLTASIARSWGIQVGAFSAFDNASRQATEAAVRLRPVLSGLHPAVTSVRGEAGIIYRARVLGLPGETAARDACARLGAWDGGCVVVRPDGVDVALGR